MYAVLYTPTGIPRVWATERHAPELLGRRGTHEDGRVAESVSLIEDHDDYHGQRKQRAARHQGSTRA